MKMTLSYAGDYGALETMSMPGTPLGLRRGQAPGDHLTRGGGGVTRGGSLERNKRAAEARGVSEAYSDTEYVQVWCFTLKPWYIGD